MTEEEFKARQRRVNADIEDARKALVLAQARFDDLCHDARSLRIEWQEQGRRQQATS